MNVVIRNGFGDIPTKEDNETFYDISSLSIIDHEDTSPVLRLLSYPIRYTLSTCLIISLVIGSYCKFVLYRYILICKNCIRPNCHCHEDSRMCVGEVIDDGRDEKQDIDWCHFKVRSIVHFDIIRFSLKYETHS